jgi:small subunit ribosomal protein S20
MPLIKSAIKKMRQDRARERVNRAKKNALKGVIKQLQAKPSLEALSLSFSALDRAAKIGLIPKRRADRKKARLAKLISKISSKTRVKKETEGRISKRSH